MTSNEIIEYLIGRAVVAHKEHIVIVEYVVCYHSGDHEEAEDAKRNAYVFLLHTSHTGDYDIEGGKQRDAMSHRRDEVWPGEDGICVIVLRRAVGSENSAKGAKDKYEVKGGFLYSSVRECGEGDGYKLYAA